ncbi:hypothetical protein EDD17DRAFT_83434 [Pisolithus thermaeus]|nr:hypothetical protein EDD17DRAFT_83434 [Pisolithus thermaeus]
MPCLAGLLLNALTSTIDFGALTGICESFNGIFGCISTKYLPCTFHVCSITELWVRLEKYSILTDSILTSKYLHLFHSKL